MKPDDVADAVLRGVRERQEVQTRLDAMTAARDRLADLLTDACRDNEALRRTLDALAPTTWPAVTGTAWPLSTRERRTEAADE